MKDLLINKIIAMNGNPVPWLRQSEVDFLKRSYDMFKTSYQDNDLMRLIEHDINESLKYNDER